MQYVNSGYSAYPYGYGMYGGARGESDWHSFLKVYFKKFWRSRKGVSQDYQQNKFRRFVQAASKEYDLFMRERAMKKSGLQPLKKKKGSHPLKYKKRVLPSKKKSGLQTLLKKKREALYGTGKSRPKKYRRYRGRGEVGGYLESGY